MQISYLNSNFFFRSFLLDTGMQTLLSWRDIDVLCRRRRKRREIFGEGEYFFWRRRNTEKEKDENIWRRSRQKLSRMLKSLNYFGLRLETFANFWRDSISISENLFLEKSLGFGFGKFGLRKKYRFRRIWSWKKSIGFGKFDLGKKYWF